VLDAIGVLLIEDDDGDALLVELQLEESSTDVRLVRAPTLDAGLRELRPDIDCVLLDLGLPDMVGLDSVARVRAAAPGLAVIVLTGLDDEAAGVAAVEAGAQDYLVKGTIDSSLLARAIRYAIGRRQAENASQQLRIAEVYADENARLERGLMARPIVADPAIWMASSYRAGRRRALLGGDFFDVVESGDGCVNALVGDVCGHGPDEAALGASLRIAWRALTLSGAADDVVLDTMERVIEHERQIPGTFATLCTLAIEPGRDAVRAPGPGADADPRQVRRERAARARRPADRDVRELRVAGVAGRSARGMVDPAVHRRARRGLRRRRPAAPRRRRAARPDRRARGRAGRLAQGSGGPAAPCDRAGHRAQR